MNIEKKGLNIDPDNIEIWEILSRVVSKSRKRISSELENLGIKLVELKVLFFLERDGTKSVISLATESEVSGPWITGIVDELERKNLVTKERSTIDRRTVRISITDKGKEILSQGRLSYEELINMALRDLSQSESEELLNILKKISKTIGE